jgi:tripartite-type tricarboxylate transporter receptor subunit TctC
MVPLTDVMAAPWVFFTTKANGIKTMAEFVERAKAEPGKLTYGSAGNGTTFHLMPAMFDHINGSKMVHVPYKGTAQILPDLIAGRVNLMFNSIAPMLPQIKEGNLKAIGIASLNRSLINPEFSTLAEQGLTDFEAGPWYGFYAPTGVPKDIVNRLNKEINQALSTADVKERFIQFGLEVASGTPEDFAQVTKRDYEKFGKIISDNNIKGE